MPLSKEFLSGSSGGRGIKVIAVAATGTTVHTTSTMPNSKDLVWLYAANDHASESRTATTEFGGTTDPDDLIVTGVPAQSGLTLISPGLVLAASSAGATRSVTMYASSSASVTAWGWVERIST